MTTKHDYKSALEWFEWHVTSNGYRNTMYENTIKYALRLAEKLTGEPSEGMVDEGMAENIDYNSGTEFSPINSEEAAGVFTAMVNRALQEIEGGE